VAAPGRVEKQLFLSYAHRDNQPLLDGQRGWIEDFQRVLKIRLEQLLGEEPKMWWDHATLHGNDVFAGVIDEGLGRSTILIPIISPSYKNSDWCQKELQAFVAAAENAGGVRMGNASRIFKVVKTPIPLEEMPPALQDLLGYEFFRKDPATGRLRELRQDAARIDPDYLQKIDDLAEDIRLFLAKLVQDRKALDVSDGPVVYLAESTSDLAAERDRVLRTLRQRGCVVLPDQPLPLNSGPRVRELIRNLLQRSKLSVHLVGARYGAIPEDETESIVAIQNRLAAERCADSTFCRLIWMASGLETADDRQRAFLDRLRNDSDAQRGAEILPTTLEDLETVIDDKLKPKKKPEATASPQPKQGNDQLKYVYLLCDRRDQQGAEALRDFLYEQDSRLEVTLPLFEGDEADLREFHKENLVVCDGVLIYFGEATEPWLRTKLLDLHKAPGYGRDRPLTAKAIWLAPPASPAKERFRTREALVISNFGGPSLDALAPFLLQLGLEQT
jgi:hypothetical protein